MSESKWRPEEDDVADVFVLFSVQLAKNLVGKDLGKPDDGGQRSTEFVGHVGEELRLMPVCCLDLSALVLDFTEQPGVLDRQG
jgi:hypothetical protein